MVAPRGTLPQPVAVWRRRAVHSGSKAAGQLRSPHGVLGVVQGTLGLVDHRLLRARVQRQGCCSSKYCAQHCACGWRAALRRRRRRLGHTPHLAGGADGDRGAAGPSSTREGVGAQAEGGGEGKGGGRHDNLGRKCNLPLWVPERAFMVSGACCGRLEMAVNAA